MAEGHCATLLMTVNQLTLHRLSWLRQGFTMIGARRTWLVWAICA
jgi:hypothetical protein